MPKMKSNRGASKRFRATGAGGIKRAKSGKSHILTSKDRKRKRALRGSHPVSEQDQDRIARMLPYK